MTKIAHRSTPKAATLLAPAALWAALFAGACGGPSIPPILVDPDASMVDPPSYTALPLGMAATGSASASQPDGYSLDLPAGDEYALVLENAGIDLTATVYAHRDRTGALGSCSTEFFSQACLLTLPAGPVYVELSAGVFAASYRMTLVRIRDEGTALAPVSLSSGAFTDLHTVARGGTSYWSFTATTSGGHQVDVRAIDVVPNPSAAYRLDWFANADFTGTPVRTCMHYTSACMGDDMAPGTYALRITNTGTQPLVLHAQGVHSLSEGAWADPVPLTLGAVHAGAFDGGLRSFYTFTTSAHAGGYVFDFPAVVSADYAVSIYAAARDTTAVSSCSTRDRCMLTDLEPNTTYYAVVTGSYGLDYDLTVTAGLSEGTLANRVPLQLGVEYVGALDAGGTSRYSFTPTVSGYYDLVLPATVDFFADLDVFIVDPDNAWAVADDCFTNPCMLGALEAGVTYGFDVKSTGFEGSLPLTVVRQTGGDGTSRSPYPLAVGDDRATDINTAYGNDYRVVTTGHTGPIAVVLYSSGGFWLTSASRDILGECVGNARIQTCTFPAPYANDAIDLHVQRSGTPNDLRLHVFDAARAAGCEADAVRCFDFEGMGTTMPAAITEPATSGRAFTVTTTAANLGTYGVQAATNASSSCFELTTPVGSAFAAFDLDYVPAGAFDSFAVRVDGTGTYFDDTATAGYERRAVAFSPATSHQLTFCLTMSGNGTRHAYVDDLELH